MANTYPMYEGWAQTWYNQFGDDWQVVFWDMDMIKALFCTYSNAAELLATLSNLPNKASQSDFARYVIVFAYGGMYVDTDMECLRKFDMLLHDVDKDIYVSLNTEFNSIEQAHNASVNNHWFYCPAPHFIGLWNLVCDIVAVAVPSRVNADWTLCNTGPKAFTNMVRQHRVCNLSWRLVEGKSLVNCEDRYKYTADAFPGAYAVHHASGTWLPINPSVRKILVTAYGFVRKNSLATVIVCTVIISVLIGVIVLLAIGVVPVAGGNTAKLQLPAALVLQ